MDRIKNGLHKIASPLYFSIIFLLGTVMLTTALAPIPSPSLYRCDLKSVVLLVEPFERRARSSLDVAGVNRLVWIDPTLFQLQPDLTFPENDFSCSPVRENTCPSTSAFPCAHT